MSHHDQVQIALARLAEWDGEGVDDLVLPIKTIGELGKPEDREKMEIVLREKIEEICLEEPDLKVRFDLIGPSKVLVIDTSGRILRLPYEEEDMDLELAEIRHIPAEELRHLHHKRISMRDYSTLEVDMLPELSRELAGWID